MVAYNESGYRVGESHHNSTIPQSVVDAVRIAHEDEKLGYRRLSRRFSLKRSTIQKICRYEIRAQTPREWRRAK